MAALGESIVLLRGGSLERLNGTTGELMCRLEWTSGTGSSMGIGRDSTAYIIRGTSLVRINSACVETGMVQTDGVSLAVDGLAAEGDRIYTAGYISHSPHRSTCAVFVRQYDAALTERWRRSDTLQNCARVTTSVRADARGNLLVVAGVWERAFFASLGPVRFWRAHDTAGTFLESGFTSISSSVPLATDSSGAVYVFADVGSSGGYTTTLIKRNPRTRLVEWQVPRGGTAGALLGDTIFVADGSQLYLHDARTGKLIY